MVIITGILAGIWPCGIITLAEELFLAESKSQVYGSIHSFMEMNQTSTSDISRLKVYSSSSVSLLLF